LFLIWGDAGFPEAWEQKYILSFHPEEILAPYSTKLALPTNQVQ
jgi:hypothetical protein